MITPESLKLRKRRLYMLRLDARPDTMLIACPQIVKFGVKILAMQIQKLEDNDRDTAG